MNSPIVVDSGSSCTRAGIGGGITPLVEFPTIVGRRSWSEEQKEQKLDLDFVGLDAVRNRSRLNLIYQQPIQGGHVVNWDDMEKIWYHTFYNELGIKTTEHSILLTETSKSAIFSRWRDREKLTEIMFETFDFPAMFLADPAVLALITNGRRTGIVVDSGDTVSRVVPVYEYHALTRCIRNPTCTGGRQVTHILREMLERRGHHFPDYDDMEILDELKEKFCRFAPSAWEQEEPSVCFYKLPDGQIINLGEDRWICPEIIFQPSTCGLDSSLEGLHQCLQKTILGCDKGLRKTLYKNVVLTGGNSMFTGFTERLHEEMRTLIPARRELNVIPSRVGKHSAWIGGSVMSSVSTFQNMAVSKQEYFDLGSKVIQQKCF